MNFITPAFLNGMAVIAFLVVQCIVGVTIIVGRYHFKAFALPNDTRVKRVATIFTYGSLIGLVAAGFALYAVVSGL